MSMPRGEFIKRARALPVMFAMSLLGVAFFRPSSPLPPHPLQWLPSWSPMVALAGCFLWPLASLGFLCSAAPCPNLTPSKRIRLYLAGSLPPGLAAWVLWGNAEIIPLYLACLGLPMCVLEQTMYETRTGMRMRTSWSTPSGSQPRPLDRPNARRFLALYLLSSLGLLSIGAACLLILFFAAEKGFAFPSRTLSIHREILGSLLPALFYFGWSTVGDVFPDAPARSKAVLLALANIPLLAGLAVGSLFLLRLPWIY